MHLEHSSPGDDCTQRDHDFSIIEMQSLNQKIAVLRYHFKTSAYDLPVGLPRSLFAALELLSENEDLQATPGKNFASVYIAIKETEVEEFQRVISPWEREYLLLNV